MSSSIIFENISKQYRLGLVSTGTIAHDLNRWWTMNILRKEDPYLKIGETNDRSHKGSSEYVWALKDINFKVEQGDVVGIIGKNGAGKSTLLKLLSRVTAPTTGCIKARGRIASLLEVGTGFHPEMTGRENIFMNGAIMGMTKQEIGRKLDEIIDFSGCERYIDTPVKRYSSGMTVRLGFAIAAHLEPEILVVDEVLAVGDAEFQKKAIGKMKDVSQGGGRTVLFVSHNMDSMLNLCDKGILLNNGQIEYIGDINSTVSKYLSEGNSSHHFLQMESRNVVYVNEVKFNGSDENRNGLFHLDEQIQLSVKIGKRKNCVVDPKCVVGICIRTERDILVSVIEESIDILQNANYITFNISCPQHLLMPGNYYIQVDLHIPNVCYFDKQKTVFFTIFDNGTKFLKYNGADNGILSINANIEKKLSNM